MSNFLLEFAVITQIILFRVLRVPGSKIQCLRDSWHLFQVFDLCIILIRNFERMINSVDSNIFFLTKNLVNVNNKKFCVTGQLFVVNKSLVYDTFIGQFQKVFKSIQGIRNERLLFKLILIFFHKLIFSKCYNDLFIWQR